MELNIFLFGVGVIGKELLNQINQRQIALAQLGKRINIISISNSRSTLYSASGIKLDDWQNQLQSCITFTPISQQLLTNVPNPVFIDCTASDDITLLYPQILESGFHLITANKRGNSCSLDFYHQIRLISQRKHVKFLYSTNCGAGLPILDVIRELYMTGDELIDITSIPSGSLSFIFTQLNQYSFADVVKIARENGHTEPDPRDDLSCQDVLRKTIIMAREFGMNVDSDDVQMTPLFPPSFSLDGTIDEFMSRLPEVNDYFARRSSQRLISRITPSKCSIELVDSSSLPNIGPGENIFIIKTKRYNEYPMVIKGYGAGSSVTAAGVFGDILTLFQ